MVVPKFVVMDLAADVGETFAEGHDEISHVMDNFVFYNPLIYIFITLPQLLSVDEVQKVGVFEHLDSAEGLFVVGNAVDEVVGHFALVMVRIFGDFTFQCFVAQL